MGEYKNHPRENENPVPDFKDPVHSLLAWIILGCLTFTTGFCLLNPGQAVPFNTIPPVWAAMALLYWLFEPQGHIRIMDRYFNMIGRFPDPCIAMDSVRIFLPACSIACFITGVFATILDPVFAHSLNMLLYITGLLSFLIWLPLRRPVFEADYASFLKFNSH